MEVSPRNGIVAQANYKLGISISRNIERVPDNGREHIGAIAQVIAAYAAKDSSSLQEGSYASLLYKLSEENLTGLTTWEEFEVLTNLLTRVTYQFLSIERGVDRA